MVKDYTKCSSHVDSLAQTIVLQVLASICAAVPVNILKFVLAIGNSWVEWVMVVRFTDLSDPRSHGHELLGRFVLLFEDGVFLELLFMVRNVVFAIHHGETLLLVVSATPLQGFVRECWVVFVPRYCSG